MFKRIRPCIFVRLLILLLPGIVVTLDQRPLAAETVPSIAAAWTQAYEQTPRLYVQWRAEVTQNLDLSELEAVGFSGPGTDAFAKLDNEYFRRYTRYDGKPATDRGGGRKFRDAVFVTQGSNVLSGSWVYNDDGSRTPENFHIDGGGYADDGSEGMLGHLFQSRQYMEDIGCPYYDGKYASTWRRESYHQEIEKIRDFDAPVSFSVLEALKDGAYEILPSSQTVDGQTCIVLERPGIDRIWLSKAYNFAIVQRHWHWVGGDSLMMTVHNSDFKQLSSSLWLPQKTERRNFVDTKRHPDFDAEAVHFTVRCQLLEVQVGNRIDEQLLEVVPDKGMTIMDNTRMTQDGQAIAIGYVAGQTPEDTERSLQAAIAKANFVAQQRATQRGWWLSVAVLVTTAILAVYFFRRRRLGA